ncbi:MAG: T9SS type A sorting domain-containing protein [Bacteroidota bacterium]
MSSLTRLLVSIILLLSHELVSAQPSAAFFTESFASGLPASWSVSDNSGNGVNWKYSTAGAVNPTLQPFPSLISAIGTSAADGFMLYDSDSAGQSVGGEDADLTTIRIDCSGRSNVHLAYNQLLVHLNEIARITISTDSTSWYEIARPSDSLLPYTATSNPEAVDIDISSVADQQPAVWLRFNFYGDYDFWWMIDDVRLYEVMPFVDVSVESLSNPTDDCGGLTAAEVITLEIKNEGTLPATDFQVGYRIDGQQTVQETISDTIPPGATMSYSFQTTADLSLPIVHEIGFHVAHPLDTVNGNDSAKAWVLSGPLSDSGAASSFENEKERRGWSSINSNLDAFTWTVTSNEPNDPIIQLGASCMALELPSGATFTNDWLVSPCIQLSDTTSYVVDYWMRTLNDSTDGFVQLALLDDPASTNNVLPLGPIALCSDTVYTPFSSATFTPPVSGSYHIGFQGLSAFGRVSIRIDGFQISENGLNGIAEFPQNEVQSWPNPFTDRIVVSSKRSKITRLRFFSCDGRMVLQQDCDTNEPVVANTSALENGTYILEINCEEKYYRKKIIKAVDHR